MYQVDTERPYTPLARCHSKASQVVRAIADDFRGPAAERNGALIRAEQVSAVRTTGLWPRCIPLSLRTLMGLRREKNHAGVVEVPPRGLACEGRENRDFSGEDRHANAMECYIKGEVRRGSPKGERGGYRVTDARKNRPRWCVARENRATLRLCVSLSHFVTGEDALARSLRS